MADERIRVCCRVRPFNDRERGGAGCPLDAATRAAVAAINPAALAR